MTTFPETRWVFLGNDEVGTVGHIALTFRIWHEDDAWQGICTEPRVPSFGETPGAALDSVLDATLGYLNEIEHTGDRERVFRERGVLLRSGEPSQHEPELVREEMTAGQSVSRLDLGLRTAAVV